MPSTDRLSITKDAGAEDPVPSGGSGFTHGDSAEKRPHTARNIALVLAAVILLFAMIAATVLWLAPPSSPAAVSTSYNTGADTILSSAVKLDPAGYILESSMRPSSNGASAQTADWAVLGQPGGSAANMTVRVFISENSSQAYFARFVSSVKVLSGYTDLSSALGSYQQYGKCYGYGEDVDGIAVANGICTKGNVFLQAHLVSGAALSDLEVDMSTLMGALYQSVA